MLRLIYITTNLDNSGGVSKLLSVKLNYLVQTYNYDIHVINTNSSSSSFFYHFDDRINIYSLKQNKFNSLNFLTYKNKLKRALKNIDEPDIIINCDNGLKGALLPFLINIKEHLIFESHNSKNTTGATILAKSKIKLQNFLFSLSLKKYKWVIVYKHAKYDWKSKNIKVISNPLGFKQPEAGSSLRNKVVIAVGRISYQKGYENLLKIWKIVVDKHPDWILNIYGEGNINNLKKLALELDITNKVQYFEPVTNIKNVYLNASMLLNTSRYEPFGIALIEAMACGLPVIAFNNTLGPKSYIVNNENGFLINQGDLLDYANKIMILINDKKEIKRISNNAKDSVAHFDLDIIMKQWHKLFQSIE